MFCMSQLNFETFIPRHRRLPQLQLRNNFGTAPSGERGMPMDLGGCRAAAASSRVPGLRSGKGQIPCTEQLVPLNSRTEKAGVYGKKVIYHVCSALLMLLLFRLLSPIVCAGE